MTRRLSCPVRDVREIRLSNGTRIRFFTSGGQRQIEVLAPSGVNIRLTKNSGRVVLRRDKKEE